MLITDQLFQNFEIQSPPKKIISLVPSQTELLYDLGLENSIVGITKFCIHPAHFKKTKQVVGGTKNLNIEKIKQLKPDLIIANKEENERTQIEELTKVFPVFVSDVQTINSAFEMMRLIGKITDTGQSVSGLIDKINSNRLEVSTIPLRTVVYLIWKNPFMTVGGDTFINSMLKEAGFENCFTDSNRYPEINISQIEEKGPEFVFLSSEPYPFKEKHVSELEKILPKTKVLCVDGEMFSWYGSRMHHAFRYFKALNASISDRN